MGTSDTVSLTGDGIVERRIRVRESVISLAACSVHRANESGNPLCSFAAYADSMHDAHRQMLASGHDSFGRESRAHRGVDS
ncbi:hypothetical protein DR64_8100 [Paraburkholderia xenovorans LB400]|nr:hypothetical protein DR64_8100 [Paraburkholderia xenovorans LB400]